MWTRITILILLWNQGRLTYTQIRLRLEPFDLKILDALHQRCGLDSPELEKTWNSTCRLACLDLGFNSILEWKDLKLCYDLVMTPTNIIVNFKDFTLWGWEIISLIQLYKTSLACWTYWIFQEEIAISYYLILRSYEIVQGFLFWQSYTNAINVTWHTYVKQVLAC